MKQSSDVTRKNYATPTAFVLEIAEDAVRTSGVQEVGVSWKNDWNNAWDGWKNQGQGG